MGRRAFAALLATLAVMTGACSASSGSTLKRERTGTVDWRPCATVECGSLAVPLDAAHPTGAQITLALARLPSAGKRVGVLFTNPGGPGGSGVEFLRSAADVFPAEIRDAFDIVSWDPRGVGGSSPVQCDDELDAFYTVDRDPPTAAGVASNVAAAHALVDSCRRRSAAILPYLSTAASASDLDAIRAAMGLEQITYVGFSYGTLLGALYADRFPGHVRAMVLDGAIDPARSYAQSTIEQAKSFDDDLAAFFDHCRNDSSCAFARGGDPAQAFGDLTRTIRGETEPATVDGEHRTLGPGELDIAVASALYAGTAGYDELARGLAQAASGTGDRLLALADDYTGRKLGGKYTNETAALYAIGCIDGPAPTTTAAVQQLAIRAARVAPHFGPSTVWLGLPCTFWPVSPEGRYVAIHARGAPPIVVVGTTHDPATPYAWAKSLASELTSGVLLTSAGVTHTSYGRGDACVDGAVDHYLLRLVPPAAETQCA